MLKRPLAILGRRKIRQDLVEAAMIEACGAPGPRHTLSHIGQIQNVLRDVNATLDAKNLPLDQRDGASLIYVHGTHQKIPRRDNIKVKTLQLALALRKATWMLEDIKQVDVWKTQRPYTHLALPREAVQYILTHALRGIGSSEPDPQALEGFDLGGFLSQIACITLPKDPSAHEKLSAIQVVEGLIASGYARK